jgi:hypothetical protein
MALQQILAELVKIENTAAQDAQRYNIDRQNAPRQGRKRSPALFPQWGITFVGGFLRHQASL